MQADQHRGRRVQRRRERHAVRCGRRQRRSCLVKLRTGEICLPVDEIGHRQDATSTQARFAFLRISPVPRNSKRFVKCPPPPNPTTEKQNRKITADDKLLSSGDLGRCRLLLLFLPLFQQLAAPQTRGSRRRQSWPRTRSTAGAPAKVLQKIREGRAGRTSLPLTATSPLRLAAITSSASS
jgi:hypothetical protein